MILASAIIVSSPLVGLADPALRAIVVAAVAGLGLCVFRVKDTSLRLWTWKVVLCTALAMPLLAWTLPHLPIPVLRLPRNEAAADAGIVHRTSKPEQWDHAQSVTPSARNETHLGPAPQPIVHEATFGQLVASLNWSAVTVAIYLVVIFIFVARILVGIALSRRLMRSSQAVYDERLASKLSSRAQSDGLGFVPQAATSERVSVPVTMGVLRSTILLPLGWREWDDATLDAVVAHEVSHIARRDALTQFLSLAHRAVFWFSPLAWWLNRHLADLAEQASDEAALSSGADRNQYARTLLGFFETVHAAPGRVWWQGVSMATPGRAEQRLENVLAWRGAVPMNLKKSIAIAVIALAIPLVCLAAALQPVAAAHPLGGVRSQDAPAPPAASAPTSAGPSAPATPAAEMPRNPGPVSSVAPVAPADPAPPMTTGPQGFSYRYAYDQDEGFVIVSGKSDAFTMSGSVDDARHAERLRKKIPGDFIWVRRGEKSYIIRDQATVERARSFWAGQDALGKKQEELGKQQEVLGKQQEALGDKMEKIRVQVPDLTAELDKLRAELKQLGSGASVEQIGHVQAEIGELQAKLGGVQSSAGEQQSKLGEEMGALGEKQGKLGEQQGELGRQQGDLARKAFRQTQSLIDECIKNGTAQPEPASSDNSTL